MLNYALAGICDLIYPPHCPLCQTYYKSTFPFGTLCPACQNLLEYNKPPFCVKCSRYLGQYAGANVCAECCNNRPAFDFAWAACIYNDALKQLIHQFKFHQKTYLAHQFAVLIVHYLEKYNLDIKQFDCIVPVPVSAVRLRERGYNQSELIAQKIAGIYNMNIINNNLVKPKNTKSQSLLNEKERWTNNIGAFRINSSNPFFHQSVLLVDDLLTTGATASEAALLLKMCGAKTVGVLTLAITL